MVRTGTETFKRIPRHLRTDDIPSHTFTPRTYQVELLDAALKRNTIVCLGSSSGNTFISVMLLRELSKELRQKLDDGGKRSVVLLNTVENVETTSKVIHHHSDLNVARFVEDSFMDGADYRKKFHDELNTNQIIVTMPDIFEKIMYKNLLCASDIRLIIIENCHFILQEDHPYCRIMERIRESSVKNDSPTRILGLTSSFISQKCQDPEELGSTIRSLEELLHAKAETATLVIAERYGIRPKEQITECDNYEDTTGTLALIDEVLTNGLDFLKDCNMEDENDDDRDPKEIPIFTFTECLNILYTLGPWCASCIASMFINQISKVDKHESIPIHKKFLKYCLTQLRIVTALFDQNFTPNYDVEELLQYSTPKMYRLVNHLRKYKPDYDFMIVSSGGGIDGFMEDNDIGEDVEDESDMSDDSMAFSDDDDSSEKYKNNIIHIAVKKETENTSLLKPIDPLSSETEKYLCGIIFVDHRYVALAINKFLEEVCSWDENLCFVKSHHLTGQSIKEKKTKKGSHKKQEDVLRKFRLQELNLLVSTSVLEDGIDIPKCNLIVKFDPPRTYKSYSQSKGRARARDSEYVILIEQSKVQSFTEDFNVFKGIEGVLVQREQEDQEPEQTDDYSELLQPYIPNQADPYICVTMDTAIAFVNRYCAKLPSDAFTHLTPKCTILKTKDSEKTMYTALLDLPINSPYKKTVEGDPMPTRDLAKKAVAIKMCKVLHKAGELDDQLMPVGKEIFGLEEEEEITEIEEEEEMSGEGRPGTTKRKQYYFKRLALSLLDTHPKESGNYLYILCLNLNKPISDDQNTRGRKICAPEETSRGFGLLTSKLMPQVPTFPVYTRSGEVTASVDLYKTNLDLTSGELERLRKFHRFTFTNVLRLEKDPMDFNPDQSQLGYLVVPLNTDAVHNLVIDWDFIEEVEKSNFHVKRNIYDSNREVFVFSMEDYEDAVVMPSYRNVDQPQHFYVAEIRFDLNPLSSFPSPELYKTFSAYYTTKYGLSITNFEQPLLDVDHTSARLNLLTPRYMNQKGVALPTSSAETKKSRRENLQQKQILVPELCEIHVFPASLWRKAVCLPTILYRLNYLLVSEEIRVTIAEGTGIGLVKLEEGFRFQPLDFGFDLKEDDENHRKEKCDLDRLEEVQEVINDQEKENIEEESFPANNTDINRSVDGTNTDSVDGTNTDPTNSMAESDISNCDKPVACQNHCDNIKYQKMCSCQTPKHCDKAFCDIKSDVELSFQIEKAAISRCDKQKDIPENLNIKNGYIDHIDEFGGKDVTLLAQSFENCCNCDSVTTSEKEHSSCPMTNLSEDLNKLNVIQSSIKNCTEKENCASVSQIYKNFPEVSAFNISEEEKSSDSQELKEAEVEDVKFPEISLSLDKEVDLSTFVGPSPCTILQALTMSNANDFFSLERLETIGDSFLKYAITVYLYCTYPGIHEGKLSYLRSKQVSNCNLYRLGKRKGFADCMISTKFEPYENWLPPGYVINEDKRKGPVPKVLLMRNNLGQLEKVTEPGVTDTCDADDQSLSWLPQIVEVTNEKTLENKALDDILKCHKSSSDKVRESEAGNEDQLDFETQLQELVALPDKVKEEETSASSQLLIPYNLQTLHSIPDKSIADCVESLIGCYLTSCGKKAALKFMHWLGLKVLPQQKKSLGQGKPELDDFPSLQCPDSPLLTYITDSSAILSRLLIGYERLEQKIGYEFQDKSYLLQAFTHASYHYNTITDCYQRLEFLGDAILDYVITRHLYEDSCKYSPGVLTDLRSALVNNNIFAALAVKWDFHKYFKAISPPLFGVIEKFVSRQKEREDEIDLSDEEGDGDEEHVELEVPKALGDIFESLAGAIYLDSKMSLDTVWRVYYRIMKPQIDKYLKSIPKSPVRELLEMEPETAKFEKPERTLEGKIRVTVNVVTKGVFTGIGRNYRIAKSAAAKKALRSIKAMQSNGLI